MVFSFPCHLLDCRIFIGRSVVEAEALIFWPPDVKSQVIRKDPNAGKDWRQQEKGAAEDEMVREHHRLSGQKFEQTAGDSRGQRSLVCWWSMGSQRVEHDLVNASNNNAAFSCLSFLICFLILKPFYDESTLYKVKHKKLWVLCNFLKCIWYILYLIEWVICLVLNFTARHKVWKGEYILLKYLIVV